MLDAETKTAIDGALKTFNEYKNTMDGLKTDMQTMRVKTDVIDLAKIDKMAKDIADGIEAVQQAKAKAEFAEKKAAEAEKKAQELETAFNRAPAAGGSEEKSKEVRKKVNKAFNDFAR